MIKVLDTGYKPPELDLASVDKRSLFNSFAKARFMLRKHQKMRKQLLPVLEEWKFLESCAKSAGNINLLRESRSKIQLIEHYLSGVQKDFSAYCVDSMLQCAHLIDRIATLDEKAALLGLSSTAIRLSMKSYDMDESDHGGLFTLLLSHMPDSHADDEISVPVTIAIIHKISSDPIANRKTNQYMNELFGQEVFPVPDVPKPTLVK